MEALYFNSFFFLLFICALHSFDSCFKVRLSQAISINRSFYMKVQISLLKKGVRTMQLDSLDVDSIWNVSDDADSEIMEDMISTITSVGSF